MYAGVVQTSPTANFERNLRHAQRFIEEAARAGVRLIVLPELFSCFRVHNDFETHFQEAEAVCRWASDLSRRLAVFLVAGSMLVPSDKHSVSEPDRGKLRPSAQAFNRSILFGPDGKQIAAYDKIHLFDCLVPESVYLESGSICHGNNPVCAKLNAAWTLGMSICYDLRFPELFRILSSQGTNIIALPASFTERTGRDHWELLLRARAVENQCYVLAANQIGVSDGGIKRCGRSMIIDPWGNVIAQMTDCEGWVSANLNAKYLGKIRGILPVLEHRRIF